MTLIVILLMFLVVIQGAHLYVALLQPPEPPPVVMPLPEVRLTDSGRELLRARIATRLAARQAKQAA